MFDQDGVNLPLWAILMSQTSDHTLGQFSCAALRFGTPTPGRTGPVLLCFPSEDAAAGEGNRQLVNSCDLRVNSSTHLRNRGVGEDISSLAMSPCGRWGVGADLSGSDSGAQLTHTPKNQGQHRCTVQRRYRTTFVLYLCLIFLSISISISFATWVLQLVKGMGNSLASWRF